MVVKIGFKSMDPLVIKNVKEVKKVTRPDGTLTAIRIEPLVPTEFTIYYINPEEVVYVMSTSTALNLN